MHCLILNFNFYEKSQKTIPPPRLFVVLAMLVALFGCERKQQEVLPNENTETATTMQARTIKRQGNPLSIRNIRFAAGKLAGKSDAEAERHNVEIPLENQLLYFRFDPMEARKFSNAIDEDSTVTLLDYPFAEVNIYREAFEGAEVNTENLRDGKIYGVISLASIANLGEANYQILDTLYQSDNDEEDPLVWESLLQTGFASPDERLRICRNFLRGTIRHEDAEFGSELQPVRGMQVFALIFGVPRRAFSDANGFFQSRKRIMIGGFVFTKAANPAMLVRPINSTANNFFVNLGVIISNFIIGSVTDHGWVPCRDINNIRIEYRGHTQRNLWCHMMNAIFMHHTYMRADNLNNVTPRRLIAYAHWSDVGGAASAPMLNKIVTANDALLAGVFSMIMGVEPSDVFAFFLIYKRYVPDITINESDDFAHRRSSSELMQTMFHELGHAAHFSRTGRANWLAYIGQIVSNNFNGLPCGSIYGCGNETNAGIVQVGEAWAEFIGTEHARRYHPNGRKCSEFFRATTGNCSVRFDVALERERWFEQEFIGVGIFHDLIDEFNTDPFENDRDRAGGANIRELYNALTPQATNLCNYQSIFMSLTPRFNFSEMNDIWQYNLPANFAFCNQ